MAKLVHCWMQASCCRWLWCIQLRGQCCAAECMLCAVQVAHNIKQGEPIFQQLPVSCGMRLTQQMLSRNQLAMVEHDTQTGKVGLP